jgi:hypothetical protein
MRVSEKAFQRRVALALAHLCSADDQRKIFIDHNGMNILSQPFCISVMYLAYEILFMDTLLPIRFFLKLSICSYRDGVAYWTFGFILP